ncbi:hypothetical protein ACIQAL_21960 [Pseudomonas sp. NPDC088368]|uniref:hypothetical protein n=1 Tax=Pseudomonas sp. NPDC088368 TaxID=3364453 RepID=UPI0038081FF0
MSMIFIQIVSVVGWGLLVVIVANSRSNRFRLPLDNWTVRTFEVLSQPILMCFVFFCFARSLMWICGIAPWDIQAYFVAFLFGLGVAFWLRSQGLFIPLGYGVKLTIDKAPDLGVETSEYVFSFHVGENMLKHRQEVTQIVARNLLRLSDMDQPYDVVFKSWVLGTHNAKLDVAKRFRRCLLLVVLCLCIFLTGICLAGAMWKYTLYYQHDFYLVEVGAITGLASFVVPASVILWCYSVSFIVSPEIFKKVAPGFHNGLSVALLKKLSKATVLYDVELLPLRPLSTVYLGALSVGSRKAFESCDGNEGGFVLKRK